MSISDNLYITPKARSKIEAASSGIITIDKTENVVTQETLQTPLLLPYQQAWVRDNHPTMIWEKSRRIGATWCDAVKSVLDAIGDRPTNSYYIGTSKEMTMDYLRAVAYWARAFQVAAQLFNIELVDEILIFRVRFATGKEIAGISSRPSSLRGKDGNVIIDESAFLLDFAENRKAAQAMLVWGRQVRYISTHNGVDNEFNKIVQEVTSGQLSLSHHRTTFKEAIAQGLYKRICLSTGKPYILEEELEWEQQIRDLYGIGSGEELDCIPGDYRGGGLVFSRDCFRVVDKVPDFLNEFVRYWDLASTPAEVTGGSYTASVLAARDIQGHVVILDVQAFKRDIAGVNTAIQAQAIADGHRVAVRWEKQPATGGHEVDLILSSLLVGFDARGSDISGNKLARAKPAANAAYRGEIIMVRGHWNSLLTENLYLFDGSSIPLVTDIADAFSGVYNCCATGRGRVALAGGKIKSNPFLRYSH